MVAVKPAAVMGDSVEVVSYETDEALARALQGEYELQDYQRRNSRRSRGPSSIPTTSTVIPPPPENPSFDPFGDARTSSIDAQEAVRRQREASDLEYARRLEQEMRASAAPSPPRALKSSSTPSTSRSNSFAFSPPGGAPGADDELYARRLEQELRDEELARRIVAEEEGRVSASRAQQQQLAVAAQPQKCSARRVFGYMIPLVIVAAAVVGIVYYFYGGPSHVYIPGFGTNPQTFGNSDPFHGINASEANRWQNRGTGLKMLMLNALTDEWTPYFDLAVAEWGDSPSLELQSQKVAADSSCVSVQGVIKVCNGNYGATDWRGINKVLLENGLIVASTARMNEYYFGTGDSDQRQYTMCHEIGHGFGLPHTDENFYNKDLGNCLDYTIHPQVNKQPDNSNFIFLQALYGDIPGKGTITNTTPHVLFNSDGVLVVNFNGSFNGTASSSAQASTGTGNRALLSVFDGVDALFDNTDWTPTGRRLPSSGWQTLAKSSFGETHVMDLGNGYTIRVDLIF